MLRVNLSVATREQHRRLSYKITNLSDEKHGCPCFTVGHGSIDHQIFITVLSTWIFRVTFKEVHVVAILTVKMERQQTNEKRKKRKRTKKKTKMHPARVQDYFICMCRIFALTLFFNYLHSVLPGFTKSRPRPSGPLPTASHGPAARRPWPTA